MIKNYISILGVSFLLQGCLPYLVHLGKGQLEILYNREPIQVIIEQNKYPQAWIEKLKLVQDARTFAVESLGLNPKGGYIYFSKLDRKEVGWHVTASEPLSFEPYQWWFPIVGSVPYKGYFDLEKTKAEENELIAKGLDTRLRITAGYSTLGWFSDPLLSPQLKLRKDELVALVIHEMAHATIYFDGDSVFNESYATFVEEEGTKRFYSRGVYSEEASILKDREKGKKEQDFLRTEIKKTAEELKALYASNLQKEDKLLKKRELIEAYRERILKNSDKISFLDKDKFSKIKLNNENFTGVMRYHSGEVFFQKLLHQSQGNFFQFQELVRSYSKKTIQERGTLLEQK
jgi:predicted aminopeptidase